MIVCDDCDRPATFYWDGKAWNGAPKRYMVCGPCSDLPCYAGVGWAPLPNPENARDDAMRNLELMLARCKSGLSEPIAREHPIRKPKACVTCGRMIFPGEMVVEIKGGSGGSWFSLYTCRGACELPVGHVTRHADAVPF